MKWLDDAEKQHQETIRQLRGQVEIQQKELLKWQGHTVAAERDLRAATARIATAKRVIESQGKIIVKRINEVHSLTARIATLEGDNAALLKAVEWMKKVGEFFRYKAPEQIDGVKLTAAMYATAEDALSKTAALDQKGDGRVENNA